MEGQLLACLGLSSKGSAALKGQHYFVALKLFIIDEHQIVCTNELPSACNAEIDECSDLGSAPCEV